MSESAESRNPDDSRPAAWRRRVTVPLLLAAVLVPYALTGYQLWQRTGTDLAFAQGERDGLRFARPLVRLIAATADAQTAAVAGRDDGGALDRVRTSIEDAETAGQQVGNRLGTAKRWADLRSELSDLVNDAPQGAAAYLRFTQVTDLELNLFQAVADSSRLILDPQLDSYYLMDTTVLRVPHLLVDIGRYADQVTMVDGRKAGGPADPIAGAVAADHVQSEIAAIDDGLRKTFDATDSSTLGPAVLVPLDRLRSTAAVLLPTSAAVAGRVTAGTNPEATTTRPAADVQSARARTRDSGLSLEQSAMEQLDLLIAARGADLSSTRRLALAAAGGGLLLVLLLGWARTHRLPALGPDQRSPDAGQAQPTPGGAGRPGAGGPAGTGPGTPAPYGTSGTSPNANDDVLAEAQELLDAGRLVRVGRALAPARDEP